MRRLAGLLRVPRAAPTLRPRVLDQPSNSTRRRPRHEEVDPRRRRPAPAGGSAGSRRRTPRSASTGAVRVSPTGLARRVGQRRWRAQRRRRWYCGQVAIDARAAARGGAPTVVVRVDPSSGPRPSARAPPGELARGRSAMETTGSADARRRALSRRMGAQARSAGGVADRGRRRRCREVDVVGVDTGEQHARAWWLAASSLRPRPQDRSGRGADSAPRGRPTRARSRAGRHPRRTRTGARARTLRRAAPPDPTRAASAVERTPTWPRAPASRSSIRPRAVPTPGNPARAGCGQRGRRSSVARRNCCVAAEVLRAAPGT